MENYTNSPLATYARISPNRNTPRNRAIDTITIHCFVGQVTAKQGCDLDRFANYDGRNGASCNYVVGCDGSIGLCVGEESRSWCTSSSANDHRAVTIEVASDKTAPYAVTDKAMSALLNLAEDICRRNGKKKLLWFGDKAKTLAYSPKPGEMVMTVHRWFAATACPGDCLYGKMGYIADEVNRRLLGQCDITQTASVLLTRISGISIATAAQMEAYIRKRNPNVAQSVIDMIPAYLSEGAAEGIRGDVAFAQSCLETGNFIFKGSAVTLPQNNFCGMGVTSNGLLLYSGLSGSPCCLNRLILCFISYTATCSFDSVYSLSSCSSNPFLQNALEEHEESEYTESKEQVAVYEMKQRINLLRQQGLPESPE